MSDQDRKVGPYLGPRRFTDVTEGSGVIERRDREANLQRRMPTPLYVTPSPDNIKQVILGFKTAEEAQAAWRYLEEMAAMHADRANVAGQIEDET